MGQGYSSVTLPAGLNPVENADIADLQIEKPLGGTRFLRTLRARHQHGVVVVKVCMKANQTVSFKEYAKRLRDQRQSLRGIPNVLAYQRVRESSTMGILVRQFIHTSLYDRISIRPFLEGIEKKWIAFQILCAVRDCHSRNIFHGDIKSENVLVTSWGWVYLTDFASAYKPVYLPEDNPADFTFYYDSSSRRTCYLAPERFLAPGEQPREGNVVQWNMDIFSLGCVLAELFTEVPTFTLSQLFRYRKGEYDPTVALLSKVDDDHIRSLISSMIRLDPGERWHAQDYLDEYKEKAFPLYFYNHLHTLMEEITDPTSGGRSSAVRSDANNGVSDDRINMIYHDYEMLSVSLGYQDAQADDAGKAFRSQHLRGLFPLQVDLPNSRHVAHAAHSSRGENGTFILLNVITSSMRSSARSTSKLRGCELLLAFAERLPDEAKLDRVLPYVISLLEDSNEIVLVAALRTMTQLLALVQVVSPVNTFLFTQYIFPRLQAFIKTDGFLRHPLVRATYAACLASLAETASRFLDIMQALKADGSLPSSDLGADAHPDDYAAYHDAYDDTRTAMLDQFEAQTKVFLTDTDNSVRRSFLTSVSSLCVFFGEARASDVLLTHLNTYLNDPDWLLKCAFFRTIVGVAVYIGGPNLEEFILPLILQAMSDPQEFVVEQAIRSLASMAEMGLLQRTKTWELIDIVARFQMHPNLWIKEAAAHFISAATTYLSAADIRILTAPLIQPYLKVPVSTLSEAELLDALKKPVPRAVLDLALQWAGRVEKGVFWKQAKESRQLSYRSGSHMPPQSSVADLGPKTLARVPKTVEDEQWLGRLRNAGMRTEDEMKILAFREYLWRAAQRMKRDESASTSSDSIFDQIISLSRLNIVPQTVIFDTDVRAYEQHVEAQDRTIAEALEEAANPGQADIMSNSDDASEATTAVATIASPKTGTGPRLELPASISDLSSRKERFSRSLSSSPSSGIGLLGKDYAEHALRSKPSAANLLGVTATSDVKSKAQAEVATDDATAVGKLNLPTGASPARKPSPAPTPARPVHNYAGNDPTVLKLLDAVYVDKYPIDIKDFGPFVSHKAGHISSNSATPVPNLPWRPQGDLVAVLSEHTAKITRVLPSPDHIFFLTGSDDGTVKVWDSARLERNVTHRSRQTYRLAPGAKVTSLCFVQSTRSFICTGSDGSVHAVKVDVTETTNAGLKYSKLRVLREWQIPPMDAGITAPEYAVWSEHFRGDLGSTLILATNLGRVRVIDLRYMSIVYDLRVAASHGAPTCFCLGRKHDWLLVGTAHGVLELWDLRFQLLLKTMSFARAAPITRLQLHPSRNSSRRNKFCVTGGTGYGEMSVWDVEKMVCHEVYRVPDAVGETRDRMQLRNYELHSMDDDQDRPNSLLRRVTATSAESPGSDTHSSGHHPPMVSHFAIQIPSSGNTTSTTTTRDRDTAFIITGGPDNLVRFWDCERLEGCRVVHGIGVPPPSSPSSPTDEKFRPKYALSQLGLDIRIITERSGSPDGDAADEVKGGAGDGGAIAASTTVRSVSRGSSNGKNSSSPGGPSHARSTSRYETIRLSARNLLRGHLDTVTDVAMLERPFGMVLSVDRAGRVLVFQ